jgi:hypothetical protein
VWSVLDERERLACDLVTFCGLRESEAYGLKNGDLFQPGAIRIQRSWYRGDINPTKTNVIREVGIEAEIFEDRCSSLNESHSIHFATDPTPRVQRKELACQCRNKTPAVLRFASVGTIWALDYQGVKPSDSSVPKFGSPSNGRKTRRTERCCLDKRFCGRVAGWHRS